MEVQCIGKGLRTMQIRVLHLDDSVHTFNLSVHATGLELFASMIERLHLLEADYFDLEFVNDDGLRCWLDHDKPIFRQLNPGKDLIFRFSVKFYTPHPNLLEEEFTRYLFALQIKRDLVSGTLLCSENTAALLASYIVQAEIGDFIEEEYRSVDYLRPMKLLHEATDVRLRRIMEFHKAHIGLSPTEADFALLDTARKVEFYGVRLHFARDNDGLGLNLAVTHLGVLVFQNLIRINTLSWAKIRKLSFKRRRFLIKLHAEHYDSIEFIFDSRDECKLFWKNCIGHHTFFRCPILQHDPQKRDSVTGAGSSFRYTGRTQQELAEYVKRHAEYRTAFQRPSTARRVNPNVLTGSNYPSRRLTSASMQLRSSSADRRGFLLKNMGTGLSSSTLGQQPALKRAQSMASGALGRDEGTEATSRADGQAVMKTSGYATMAGSAGSAQSAEAKASETQSRDWSEELQQQIQQQQQQPHQYHQPDESPEDDSHWAVEFHRRMTGDWIGNGVLLDSTSEPGRRTKSATGSPRSSAAASLTKLNTQLDEFLHSHSCSTEPTVRKLTTTATVESSNFDDNGGPIYSQPTEESPRRIPSESSTQYTLVTVEPTAAAHAIQEQIDFGPEITYQDLVDSIRLDMHTTAFPGTPTVTYSSASLALTSTDPLNQVNMYEHNRNQQGLMIAQPDVISQTDGIHAQAVDPGAHETGDSTSPSEPRGTDTNLTTFLTDTATPLRLDQSGKGTDYSVAAALLGSPIAQSRLNRDSIPNMLGQFEFRAQDGLFILPTVTQFGLEINMDRQESSSRPVDTTRQTLLTGIQTSITNGTTVYTVPTDSVMDTVMHWYTRPDPTSATVTLAGTDTGAFGTVGTLTDQTVDLTAICPRTSVIESTSTGDAVTYGLDGGFAQSTFKALASRTTTATFPVDMDSKITVSTSGSSRTTDLVGLVSESYISSVTSTAISTAIAAALTATPIVSSQIAQTPPIHTTEALPTATSADQWSSSSSDSTTGVILRPDLASSLSRITQHSTGCPHATPIQTRHQSSQILSNPTTVTSLETTMHTKSFSTNLSSNVNNSPLPSVLPINTLPARPSHRGKQPVHAHTCSRAHNLSQSIPCTVHLSGMGDCGLNDSNMAHSSGLESSAKLAQAPARSGAERRRPKEPAEPDSRHIHRGMEVNQQKRTDHIPGDMALMNGVNAAADMLEEVPYVVMRRPRSVDVKQYQLHLQRQQQQAAALAAAAAGYSLHAGGPHHAPIFPGAELGYPYASRVPMQPQMAYAPMLPSSAAYPNEGSSYARERTGGTRKSGRRPVAVGPGVTGPGGPPLTAVPAMPPYPEAYYHGMRHGMMAMPFEAEGYAPFPPGAYTERTKCKAKRKHSKSRTESERLAESSGQKPRGTKSSSSHIGAGLMSPPLATMGPNRHPGQPQEHHHVHCAHRQSGIIGEAASILPAGQPRLIAHSRRHIHKHPDSGSRQTPANSSVPGTNMPSASASASSTAAAAAARSRRSAQTTTSRTTKPDAVGDRGRKGTVEQEDVREMDMPYPVSELLFSPSRGLQPDDIRIAKGQPAARHHHHHHHHPACASLMSRVKAQAQRSLRQPDSGSIHATGSDPRLVRTRSKTQADQQSRILDKLGRPIQSSDALDAARSREGILESADQMSRDTRETIEKLREELRSAGFQVKDSPHRKPTIGPPHAPEAGRYKTSQTTAKGVSTKKISAKPSPKMISTQMMPSSSQPEAVTERLKHSAPEPSVSDKSELVGSAEHWAYAELDASFGVPPQNPVYLDSDSDSLNVVASQPKAKYKQTTTDMPTSTITTTTTVEASAIPLTSCATPGSAPVVDSISIINVAEPKLKQTETANLSSDLVSSEGPVGDVLTSSVDRADELLNYAPSPRSHSPSLPLSFPLSEFDGSEASIVSSEAESIGSGASYYSNHSSECDHFHSGSGSSVSSCSYCHTHRGHRHRSAHHPYGHYHHPMHHHACRHHLYQRHHHPHHLDRRYYGSTSRSICHCHRCTAIASSATASNKYAQRRRHQSDHRDSRRQRSHTSQSQQHGPRPHSEKSHHAGSRHSYSHRSITSSHHSQRNRHHRVADSGHHHRSHRNDSWSRTSSSGASISGDQYSDYSNSEDSFDFGSSPGNESQIGPVDETPEGMLNQLKQQERKLRNELAKHRALTNQLREAQKRTQKLLLKEQLVVDDSSKRTIDRVSVPNEMVTERDRPIEEDEVASADVSKAEMAHQRRTSRRGQKVDGRKEKEQQKKESPSTSRSSDRIQSISKSPYGRQKKDVETGTKSTVDSKVEQPSPHATGRKEPRRHVLSESHVRPRRHRPITGTTAPMHRVARVSTRGAQPRTPKQGDTKMDEPCEAEATVVQETGDRRKIDEITIDESDTLVIVNTAALSRADEEQTREQAGRSIEVIECELTKSTDKNNTALETVHEVSLLAETSHLIPTRKPWDDRDEDEEQTEVFSTAKDDAQKSPLFPAREVPVPPSTPPPLPYCIGDVSADVAGSGVGTAEEKRGTQSSHRSSFNRLTDFPDESTGENVDDDAEYNGTRILRILSGGLSRLTDSEDGVGTAAEKVTKARPHQGSTSTVLLTNGSTTTSGGDETHTSEDASVDTVKPAGASRDPSPASSSTTSASEGSEDIEPFPSPPPEIALMDPYQRCSSSPPSHSHLVISAGLDEVIEEEAGTSEMESETAAVAAAIAFLDAATTDSNDEYGKKEEQKDKKDKGKEEEQEEQEEEEEEDEETSNATVIARDTTEPHCMEEINITDGSDDTTRPNSLPELNEYADESEDEKTPTEIERPVENLIPQAEAEQLDDQASAVSKDEVQEEASIEELSGKETEAGCTVEVKYECAQSSEATLFETAAEEQEKFRTQQEDECVHLDDPPQEDGEDMPTEEDKPPNECHLGEDPQETVEQSEEKKEVVLTNLTDDVPGKVQKTSDMNQSSQETTVQDTNDAVSAEDQTENVLPSDLSTVVDELNQTAMDDDHITAEEPTRSEPTIEENVAIESTK